MGIRGSIQTMPMPEVCQWLKLGAKTGALVVERVSRTTYLYFQKGAVIDIREPDQAAAFVAFLVPSGVKPPAIRPGCGLAEALPEMGRWMLPERADGSLRQAASILERPLRDFFCQRLLDLFAWQFGEFVFREDHTPDRKLLSSPIDLDPLMIEWVERSVELDEIREILPDAPDVRVVSGADESHVPHTETEGRLLHLIRTPLRLVDVLARTSMNELEALRHLSRLAREGLVEVLPPAHAPEAPAAGGLLCEEPAEPVSLLFSGAAAPVVAEAVGQLRAELTERTDLTGLVPEATVRLAAGRSLAHLASLRLSADEGFLVSRIEGALPLRQLSTLCGLPRSTTQQLVLGLIARGVLEAETSDRLLDAARIVRAEMRLQEELDPLSAVGGGSAPTLEVDGLPEPPAAEEALPAVDDPREMAALYYRLGMRALKEQRYRRAIELLTEALAQAAESSNCWAALAQAYLLEGSDLAEAESCCWRALQGRDGDARMHLLLGHIQRRRERLDKASAAYLRALELDPANPQIQAALRSLSPR
jgi:hypothetical protein